MLPGSQKKSIRMTVNPCGPRRDYLFTAPEYTLMPDRKMNRDFTKDSIRYPDPAVEVLDARFRRYVLGSAVLERLCTGARWTAGPVWFGDGGYLLFNDIPNNRLLRWSEETERA